MAKRKADITSSAYSTTHSKKMKQDKVISKKRPYLFDESDSGCSREEDSQGGAKLEPPRFKINQDFAKRFEHNKKREELKKLEEKYQKPLRLQNGHYGDKYDEDSESSSDEDEDDIGFLATEALDAEISATLQAIRSKDPRVYNEKVTFYAPIEGDEDDQLTTRDSKAQKPLYLQDYHRENLLQGHVGGEEDEGSAHLTYAQEQADLQKSLVKEIHAATAEDTDIDRNDEDDSFLIPKKKPLTQGLYPTKKDLVKPVFDVATADKDPETFLSNFMAARAWVPGDGSRFQTLESDDDEDDERAEKFETAYNLRFEDPAGSNEVLKSYARDIVAVKSVRRDELSGRKKQRDAQREKKKVEKRQRDEERARLRRLKVDEMEEKLKMVKEAAGTKGKTFYHEEIMKLLDENWDDDKWMSEMTKYFGEDYYADKDLGSENISDSEINKTKKVRKPKWDDDIDIKDIVPEFEDAQAAETVHFTLSDINDDSNDEVIAKISRTSRYRQQEKQAKKKAARLERQKIEDLVDRRLDINLATNSKQPSKFRYRETSPMSFGLSARDILMAPDASLNQFAGLKKIAPFRDAAKKTKDKKLGKKARLRQWRMETFGNEDGPEIIISGNAVNDVDTAEVSLNNSSKKKSRKGKVKS